jgi:hypothetical protein
LSLSATALKASQAANVGCGFHCKWRLLEKADCDKRYSHECTESRKARRDEPVSLTTRDAYATIAPMVRLRQAHRNSIMKDPHDGQNVGSVVDRGSCRCSVWHDALARDKAAALDDPG